MFILVKLRCWELGRNERLQSWNSLFAHIQQEMRLRCGIVWTTRLVPCARSWITMLLDRWANYHNLKFSWIQTFLCKKCMGHFIHILDSSNSSSFTFWSSEVSWLLALEANELASEPITQMTVELITIYLISVQQKRLV